MNRKVLALCFAGVAAGGGVVGYNAHNILADETSINADTLTASLYGKAKQIVEKRGPVERACNQYSKELKEVFSKAGLTDDFDILYHPSSNLCYLRESGGYSRGNSIDLAWNAAISGSLRTTSEQDISAFISERLSHNDIKRLNDSAPDFTAN